MTESPDDRAALVQAWAWASRVMTVALEMVLPGVFGYWVDQKLGTRFVFVLLGTAFGVTFGFVHLLQMARPQDPNAPAAKNRPVDKKNNR